jgi:hypothetical protein
MDHPQQQRAGRTRLITALAVSLLVHAWLVHGYGERERTRPAASGVPFQATLTEAVGREPAVTPERFDYALQRTETNPVPAPAPRVLPVAPIAQPVAARRGVNVASERTVTAPTQVAALPQPQDPTYYSSRSLDVFPASLTQWDLNAIRAAAQQAGNARATLLIDEAGIVNEVVSVEGAPHTGAEQAIRELFLAAKFSPARKDGRVVKSRVLVNLNY